MNDDEYDTVQLNNSKRPVWLVKTPPRLAKIWDKVLENENALLGKIGVVATNNGKIEEITFHMDEKVANESNSSGLLTATDFNLKLIRTPVNEKDREPPFQIFSRGSGGVEMEGIVENSFNLQPLHSKLYDSAVKIRVSKDSERNLATKEVDSFELLHSHSKKKPFNIKISEGGLEDGGPNDRFSKRRRVDSDLSEKGLREILFSLFQKKDINGNKIVSWTKKDIKRAASDAAAAIGKGFPPSMLERQIKLLLSFNADNRDGLNARTYELRPEYRV